MSQSAVGRKKKKSVKVTLKSFALKKRKKISREVEEREVLGLQLPVK